MDDDQVGELRSWAAGLATDSRPEVKAAAKAILLLADDLQAARSQLLEERLIREALESRQPVEDDASAGTEPAAADGIDRDLRARLRGYLPRRERRA